MLEIRHVSIKHPQSNTKINIIRGFGSQQVEIIFSSFMEFTER